MASKNLDVYIAGDHAGTFSQGESGSLTCEYGNTYRGVPLSLSMPFSTCAVEHAFRRAIRCWRRMAHP